MQLVEAALAVLQEKSLPVYRRNIDKPRPPVAHGENTPAAIAVLLLLSGLDHHLARLKYLRDCSKPSISAKYPTYFNWTIGDELSKKLERLLFSRNEKRLREQLIECTIMRDSVAHPRLYWISETMRSDLSFSKPTVKLALGADLRAKAFKRKRKRIEYTNALRLPLVPTWISYPDAVTCLLVVHRFLNTLERRYGNPYAWIGSFHTRNTPSDFFVNCKPNDLKSVTLDEWTKAFFASLSDTDMRNVRKRLRGNISLYLNKKIIPPRPFRNTGSIGDMLRAMRRPGTPSFLHKPPPWPMTP